jgi:hypothetical protein
MGYVPPQRDKPQPPRPDSLTRTITLVLYFSMLATVVISVWRGISSLS